jgi:SAM-dependent methyltransferase
MSGPEETTMPTAPSPPSPAAGEAYYRENYDDYERQASPGKLEFYLGLMARSITPGSRVFELGVGQGNFLARAAATYVVEGVDTNAYGVEQAQRRVPGATVRVGSYEQLASSSPPDAVVAWDVLEHLTDLDGGLAAIRDALRPGGTLVAVVPVYDGPLGPLVLALDRDPTHVSKLGRGDWLERLRRHGFDVIEHGGIIRKLVLARWYVHVTRPQFLLRRTGSALYFVARKTSAS